MVTVFDRREPERPRHPEKIGRASNPSPPKPPWIRVRAVTNGDAQRHIAATRETLRSLGLSTVCEEAACPNLSECWSGRHATFMIMGEICTRACAFCNVATGRPLPLDPGEPLRLGKAVAKLGLEHAVVTSVDRDDLDDGGAAHFAAVIRAIRAHAPGTTIEVLTPDFLRRDGALAMVIEAKPDVFNHNVETVPRLYPAIRPGARYFQSLRLLQQAKELDARAVTKSGLMAGLGEAREEILQVMDDLRVAGVDILTIGQYLQPTLKHAAVARYLEPGEFEDLAQHARAKGFLQVSASPLTRSSYHAGDDFERIRQARRGDPVSS